MQKLGCVFLQHDFHGQNPHGRKISPVTCVPNTGGAIPTARIFKHQFAVLSVSDNTSVLVCKLIVN